MFVQKQSGGNTVKVTEEVEKMLAALKKDLPQDVKIEKLFDSASFIKDSISNLTETLMYAAIFVILVVLFFLGQMEGYIHRDTYNTYLAYCSIYLSVYYGCLNKYNFTDLTFNSDRDGC